jgi:hypothetical protein
MQGIAVPATSVRPTEFFDRTRRRNQNEYSRAFAGLGNQDVIELKKVDIVSALSVKFNGTLTSTPGAGTVATTRRWPYDIAKLVRFTANGQSNIINVSGAKLKVREMMAKGDLSDRGVPQSIAGSTVQNGTLSLASEAWGVGSGATAIAAGNYDVEIEWVVPIAEDQVDLAGAIFAATSQTDLTLTIDWSASSDLFVLTGGATATLTGTVEVMATRYSIPLGGDGEIVVPDLSLFHSLIQTRVSDSLSQGVNEPRLVGQGAGKTLLRVFGQTWQGASPATPLSVDSTNYGRLAWRYGGNETPDEYQTGRTLRFLNERQYNSDIGGQWGFFCHDFAVENAFRDAVDMGTTSEFRLVVEYLNALTSPSLEVVQEAIFQAGTGS